MKYTTIFDWDQEYIDFTNTSDYIKPNVSYCRYNSRRENKYFSEKVLHNYENDYLTIVSLEDNNEIKWLNSFAEFTNTISVSTNNGETWVEKNPSTNGTLLAILNIGDKLLIKGTHTAYSSSRWYPTAYHSFTSSNKFYVEGNIMSLIYGDNFYGQKELTDEHAFSYLFYHCIQLISAENLILSATTLTKLCYYRMFEGCTSLTTAPELPATNSVDSAYYGMFINCSSLVNVKDIFFTAIAWLCCGYMFQNCTSLTTAPVIYAQTIRGQGCYMMFNGCVSLNYIKCLTSSFDSIYNYSESTGSGYYISDYTKSWVQSVSSTGTFVCNSNDRKRWNIGINGIPTGWNIEYVHDTQYLTIISLVDNNTISWKASTASIAKTISISTNNGQSWTSQTATTGGVALATLNAGDQLWIKGTNTAYGDSSGYNYFVSTGNFDVEGNIMSLIYGDNFIGQTTLDSIGYNFKYLFYLCSKLKSAKNLILPATSLTQYCYYSMFNRCTALTDAPELSATTLAGYCYQNMFYFCSSLVNAPSKLPAKLLIANCYNGMFMHCAALTTSPKILATNLVTNCYTNMFYNCTALNYIYCLSPLASDYSNNFSFTWVTGVSSTGTFVKNPNLELATGEFAVPENWTVIDA